MRVERIPTFRDNYTYLVIDPATDEAAVVDAPEADPVIERVESLDVKVAKVLSTHHHPDHSAANPVLAERYGAPVFGHVSDAKRIPGFTDGLEEGDTISAHRMSSWSCLPVPNTRWAPDGRFVCSPAFGGHPASIVPAAYSSVPKTGQNRRTSRPHLALRGTRAPPTCTRTCAFEGPLGSPRRAIQPSSREKTAHDLRVGELQWPPEDGENVTNRTVNAPLKNGTKHGDRQRGCTSSFRLASGTSPVADHGDRPAESGRGARLVAQILRNVGY